MDRPRIHTSGPKRFHLDGCGKGRSNRLQSNGGFRWQKRKIFCFWNAKDQAREGNEMTGSSETLNLLINEKSPYLLQHARNPVDWYPWGKRRSGARRRRTNRFFSASAICGRIYSNISQRLSAISALYGSPKLGLKMLGEIFGQIPEGITVPVYPFSRMDVIKAMLPGIRYYLKKNREVSKSLSQSIKDTPDWCRRTKAAIKETNTKKELLSLWKHQLEPYSLSLIIQRHGGG